MSLCFTYLSRATPTHKGLTHFPFGGRIEKVKVFVGLDFLKGDIGTVLDIDMDVRIAGMIHELEVRLEGNVFLLTNLDRQISRIWFDFEAIQPGNCLSRSKMFYSNQLASELSIVLDDHPNQIRMRFVN